MVAALKVCKRHFKVGCITNNVVSMHSPGQDEGQRAAGAMGQVMPLFDAIIESSKAGVRKPDPRIYLMMCELLAVKPATCVYLDDLGINCKPCRRTGHDGDQGGGCRSDADRAHAGDGTGVR